MLKLLRDTMGFSTDEAPVHGFRSTFRDWVAETDFDQLAGEICLSHVVGDKSVQAYLRKQRPWCRLEDGTNHWLVAPYASDVRSHLAPPVMCGRCRPHGSSASDMKRGVAEHERQSRSTSKNMSSRFAPVPERD